MGGNFVANIGQRVASSALAQRKPISCTFPLVAISASLRTHFRHLSDLPCFFCNSCPFFVCLCAWLHPRVRSRRAISQRRGRIEEARKNLSSKRQGNQLIENNPERPNRMSGQSAKATRPKEEKTQQAQQDVRAKHKATEVGGRKPPTSPSGCKGKDRRQPTRRDEEPNKPNRM